MHDRGRPTGGVALDNKESLSCVTILTSYVVGAKNNGGKHTLLSRSTTGPLRPCGRNGVLSRPSSGLAWLYRVLVLTPLRAAHPPLPESQQERGVEEGGGGLIFANGALALCPCLPLASHCEAL